MTRLTAQEMATLPTPFGKLKVRAYSDGAGRDVLAITAGDLCPTTAVPVRVQAACFAAEALGSLACDCRYQLDFALQQIASDGGALLYLPQAGRGCRSGDRFHAARQQNMSPAEDPELYQDVAFILRDLGATRIRLITNDPRKVEALQDQGIEVTTRIAVPVVAGTQAIDDTAAAGMGADGVFAAACGGRGDERNVAGATPTAALSARSGSGSERPFIHINFALDGTGRTTHANRCATPLSCAEDWQRVHELRERYAAVVVGARTWQIDQPRLTARAQYLSRPPRRQPDRVIFAGRSACAVEPDERRTFVVGLQPQPPGIIRITALEHDLKGPLSALHRYGVGSLLVEGGLTLLRSFLRNGLADRISVYVATDNTRTAGRALLQALPELADRAFHADRLGAGVLLTLGDEAAELPR